MTGSSDAPATSGVRRLALGALALAVLGFLAAQAGRLPGPLGDTVRANIEAGRDATGLFYTEVPGWREWPGSGGHPETARRP